MKLFLIPILLTALLIITSQQTYPQSHELGIEVGYGKTKVSESDQVTMAFVFPLNTDLTDFRRVGLRYYFNLPDVPLVVKSGFIYDYRTYYSTDKMHFLRIPIGIDINVGRKVYFVLGFGWYLSNLAGYTSDRLYNKDSHKQFQLGWYINTGIGGQLSERIRLSFLYQSNFDITNLLERQVLSHYGYNTVGYKGFDGFLSLSVKYRLFMKISDGERNLK